MLKGADVSFLTLDVSNCPLGFWNLNRIFTGFVAVVTKFGNGNLNQPSETTGMVQ